MTELQRSSDDALRHALPAQFLHDLRTPLNQIIGYSDMLVEQAQEEGQNSFVADLQKIHAAGHQLLALLNNGAPALADAVLQGNDGPVPGESSLARDVSERKRAAQAVPSAVHSETSPLILVVDDNELNRDVLSRRLEKQGYGVVMAANGRLAMEAVRAQEFDLALLDIMMPEMDGYEVLQEIKADALLCHIPIIMISALHEVDSVVRCIEMGADDYLCKPFDPILLKARIGSSLEKKRAHDSETRLFEQLQQNYKRLQELEKQRDDLTNMIVHDLRTPLTSVILGMQTVEVVGDLNETQREIMAIAAEGGQTLLGMINDLLDVEKMESGSMQLDYAVLCAADLVANSTGQIASLAANKNLTLVPQLAALPPFQGDKDKLVRTLVNLLGNAIKFTPYGGTITVAARCNDAQSLMFSVSDSGEGMPPEAFEHIFEKFGQVASRQGGRVMSTGLGLTFCKLAVEAHGGHIGVESTPGEGSTFSFTIPLAAV